MFTPRGKSTAEVKASGRVKTSSQIYMRWLTWVRRFKVEEVMRHPKGYSMGRMIYDNTWILRPKRAQHK